MAALAAIGVDALTYRTLASLTVEERAALAKSDPVECQRYQAALEAKKRAAKLAALKKKRRLAALMKKKAKTVHVAGR